MIIIPIYNSPINLDGIDKAPKWAQNLILIFYILLGISYILLIVFLFILIYES